MEEFVDHVYESYDEKRKKFELQQADAEEIEELKKLETSIIKTR